MLIDEIKNGESQNIEFKQVLPEKSEKYIKTLVAYANTSGGKLIIGVEDKTKEIIGVDEACISELSDRITNVLADTVSPQIIPSITTAEIDGKTVVIVEIFPSPARPYYIKSLGVEEGTFIRVNATTRRADSVMRKELQLQGRNQSYDETVIPGKVVSADEAEAFCETIKKHREEAAAARGEASDTRDITTANLENWNVLKRDGNHYLPTIAYDVLTENHQNFAKIQCGLFKGTTKSVFIDKREYEGPIYEQIEEAYQFVLRHINLGAEIDGLYRVEKYELPPKAIREAIANAVTHRNYMDRSKIQVCVYDDRVEITSPGMLFGGLTIDMIKNGRTKIRNNAVAEVFSRMRVIEGWGSGIGRMIEDCREYGVAEPVFTEVGVDFRVEFFRNTVPHGIVNGTANGIVKTGNDLRSLYLELPLMISNPKITIKEIAAQLQIGKTTVNRHILTLKKMGILTREGSDKTGCWKVHLDD